ncbi:DUF1824 family protein [Oculatella sp. FACHB-28]|uniref:DUF1824 family protein n=1 Tax=Oculatella sp. FACHB-28 TaxID=2692845 RepID=UPI0016820DAD|nr:DUF1824 family protein [Oculatella sp. FACHB-28]MBD2054906.1 DUF1824 family protein [Oculatella sp. FACHB-28]
MTQLTAAEAHQILKPFDCLRRDDALSRANKPRIREALLTVVQLSDYQILGICADNLTEGQQALKAYSAALGYAPELKGGAIADAVYIKFNPKSGLCYAEAYTGEHRGVLVSCQSAYESGVNEMYGHLPLDLFEN